MDFVIFGMGLGATLVVLGWFWRTLGPRFRHQPGSDALLSGEQMVERISWTRFCRSGGFVWIMGGCLLLFAALVSLLLHLSDHTGALVVLAAFAVVALGVIAWVGAYLHRFGLIGLVTPRESRPEPAATAAPARPAARPALRRKQPQPAAAASQLATATTTSPEGPPAPVQGPPVPADLAARPVDEPPMPEPAATDQAPETVEGQPQWAAAGSAPASAEPAESSTTEAAEADAPATIIGAERRDTQPAGSRSESAAAADEPAAGGASAVRPVSNEAAAGAGEAARAGRTPKPASAAPATVSGPAEDVSDIDNDKEAANQDTGATRQADMSPGPAGERRVGSAAFQESIARQEANLARAAGDRAGATEHPRQAAPSAGQHAGNRRSGNEGGDSERRFPAPRGAEGVQWVRADGSGRIPGGFPVKSDPATRLYYPATAENYAQVTARYFFASARDAENAGYRPAAAPRRLVGGPDRKRPVARPLTGPRDANPDADRSPSPRAASRASNHQVDQDTR